MFIFPEAFLLLLLLVPVVLVLRRSERRACETAAALRGRAPKRSYFVARLLLACAFIVSLTMVAARPYVAYDKSASFVFVVDVSRSMHARYSCSEPTFLDRARRVLRKTVDSLPEAQMGIVAFDRFAFPVTQMTTDRAYLAEVIDHGLYVGLMLQATQTEIANALSVVAAKKRRLPEVYGSVRHVILLSDGHVGSNYRRHLQAPITELRDLDVKVSTIGIGNAEATPIARDYAGECDNQHIELNGDKVMIPLRSDILKFIATESGGDYFAESETDRLISVLRSELHSQTDVRNEAAAPRRDMSTLFLFLATLALLGFVYLPVRFRE